MVQYHHYKMSCHSLQSFLEFVKGQLDGMKECIIAAEQQSMVSPMLEEEETDSNSVQSSGSDSGESLSKTFMSREDCAPAEHEHGEILETTLTTSHSDCTATYDSDDVSEHDTVSQTKFLSF